MIERKFKMEKCGEFQLQDILSEKQIHRVLSKTALPGASIIAYDVQPASSGLIGFLGDHLRVTLHVKEDFVKKISLFIKSVPKNNQPKLDHIKEHHFYKREALVYKMLEEMSDSNFNSNSNDESWHPRALIYGDNILVMPDLCSEGYRTYLSNETFNKDHVKATMKSLARFHASFLNYVTMKTNEEGKPYDFLQVHGHIVTEPLFRVGPWLYAASKLTNNFLKELSKQSKKYPKDLEEQLTDLYIEACESLRVYENTINVVVHKDLWKNNILFKYSGDKVTNAMLLDFQCFRYAPPAFDVMQFLYFNTSRKFRECHEREMLEHYYSEFTASLVDDTKQRIRNFNYNLQTFLFWCEKGRLFGMMEAVTILPFVLMDPIRAQKNFDDPETFAAYLYEDRSVPIIQYAREYDTYKHRQLDICEEFVEKYVLKK